MLCGLILYLVGRISDGRETERSIVLITTVQENVVYRKVYHCRKKKVESRAHAQFDEEWVEKLFVYSS